MARANAQQMIHQFKSLLTLMKKNTADVHDALELALRVIAQESKHRDDAGRGDVEGQLVLENGELLHEFRETLY